MAWTIEETGIGTFDVLQNGRIVRYDEDTLEDAAKVVREKGGSKFVLVEPDGYRTTTAV